MPQHAIISTVGTSLLTNGADSDLRALLTRAANRRDLPDAAERARIEARVEEVRAALGAASPESARRMSAELNGILALDSGIEDSLHYLLCTDTFQGRAAGELLAEWLRARGASAGAQPLEGLSTADRLAFRRGVDSLLRWAEATLPELRRQGRRVTFNLVGGFKSLQAYAHTLGMFYADELVYIFESGGELIRIPRLPLAWDIAPLARHAAAVARMAQGDVLPARALPDLPEAYLEADAAGDVTLSEWGLLAWNAARRELLAGPLLEQPGLEYAPQFRADYAARPDPAERLALQEALARAALLWRDGGLAALRADGGLQYGNLRGRPGLGHFRVTLSLRVTCEPQGERLLLRRFGPHSVNEKP